MVNVKTFLVTVSKGLKYELWGGQNRVNSKDYVYMVRVETVKPRKFINEFLVAVMNNKTGEIVEWEGLNKLPEKIIEKLRRNFVSLI